MRAYDPECVRGETEGGILQQQKKNNMKTVFAPIPLISGKKFEHFPPS